eukprot:GEMP01041451.1.p1 GENE.GEMP01041451.1~~GEMP01041451.1.p1  ORF type:complete len:237 (+),score=29.74 GEMP01041451.1:122-832(+)
MSVPPEEKPFEVHFPRRTGLRGIADLISCFVIWHYVFWFPPAFCSLIVIAVTLNLLDWNTIAFLSLLYFAQLMGWRPQNKKGVPFWKYGLYTPLLDSACHQMNGTFIREVELDSKERYLFAWAPHGILGVIRCGSGGTLWSQLFPGIFPRWASFSGAFFIPGAREFSLCDLSHSERSERIRKTRTDIQSEDRSCLLLRRKMGAQAVRSSVAAQRGDTVSRMEPSISVRALVHVDAQ